MHKNHKSRYKYGLWLLPLLLSAGIIYMLYIRYIPFEFASAAFVESRELFTNPRQGFYHMRGYRLSEEGPVNEDLRKDLEKVSENGLFLLQINLGNYQNIPLTSAALTHLRELLEAWSQGNRQLILRFVYDWDGNGLESEPEKLSTVLEHMSAAGSVVNEFTHSVFLLQGLFVGDYGEMHGSRFLSEQDMSVLAVHLSESVSPAIFLSVRTPAQLRSILKKSDPLSEAEAFSGTLAARLGLFNDGMLGSITDTGTYGDTSSTAPTGYAAKLDREGELQFQNSLNRFVPNGGEVIIDNPYNDLESAIADLSRMHVSYLNADYDSKVLDKWKNSIYQGEDSFYGMNGYDYISAHLGYRYTLKNCTINFRPIQDEEASLVITLENTGFCASYFPLEASVSVRSEDNTEVLILPLTQDLRFLDGKSSTELTVTLPVRSLKAGSYKLFWKLRDAANGTELQLANPSEDNGYPLGTLIIERNSGLKS